MIIPMVCSLLLLPCGLRRVWKVVVKSGGQSKRCKNNDYFKGGALEENGTRWQFNRYFRYMGIIKKIVVV